MSGPLMGHRPGAWPHDDGIDRYVEFMCFGDGRYLMLKARNPAPGRLGAVPDELRAVARGLGWQPPL